MATSNWKDILGWGNNQIEDLRFVGYTYAREGKYDIALNIFKSLTILNPKATYDIKTLGAIYLQMGHNIEALNCFEKALKLDPEDAFIKLNRIKALYLLGYRDQATQEAKNLISFPHAQVSSTAQALINCYT